MKPRVVVIFAVVVLAVVVGAVWFLQSTPPLPTLVGEPAPPRVEGAELIANPNLVTPAPAAPGTAKFDRPVKTDNNNPPPPRALTDWERKIDEVLTSGNGETETAQLLINLLPTMPPEGQAEAAQHVTNLILDKDYGRVMPMLKNPSLAQEVHDVLVTDLMNREDLVKLPALLEVAKIPNHPYHEEAMTDLQIFLDQDNGSNWSKWDSAVRDYLRKQAAEEAAANAPAPAK